MQQLYLVMYKNHTGSNGIEAMKGHEEQLRLGDRLWKAIGEGAA